MSEWVLIATIVIIAAYKLIDRWLDTHSERDGEHRATYSTHERADSEDGYEDRIGFTKE